MEHTAPFPKIHLKVLRKKAASLPLDPAPALALATALEKNGAPEEAAQTLETLGLQAGSQPDIPGKIAPALARLGRKTSARHFFQLAVQTDPGIQHFETYTEYARFLLAEGQIGPALKTLRSAFQNPLNRSYREILKALDATQKGQSPETLAQELEPFRLPASALQTILDLRSAAVPVRNNP